VEKRKVQAKRRKAQGKPQKASEKGGGRTTVVAKRPPGVPPPDSELWPEYCRGKWWDWKIARLFVGRCQLCAYSCPPTPQRQRLDKLSGMPTFLLCTNHPDSPGALQEVWPTEMCRNFKPKPWWRSRPKPAPDLARSAPCGSGRGVRRIALGQNLFATVDAADYEKLCKYRWYASRHGRAIYARCREKGKDKYMHRMIMRPRRGYVVDHVDGNGLNNRRCNLRVCTPRQNQANRRPCGGTSRFVGVFRNKDNKWQAGIQCHGVQYYLGVYDDEVEAAKARDRKAYELHGERAYLNLPEDFRRSFRRFATGRKRRFQH